MAQDDELIPCYVPSLATILLRAEQAKRRPLTEKEVERIRMESTVVMLPPAEARKLEQTRKHPDVDPDRCWDDWQKLRDTLHKQPPGA